MAKTTKFTITSVVKTLSLATIVVLGISGATIARETKFPGNIRRGHGQSTLPAPRPRIINGEDVEELRYPYFSLMYGRSLCGGVLIAPRLVLGAAHCEGASNLFRIGLFEDIHDGQYVDIEKTFAHPEYVNTNLSNDIMIFELVEAVNIPYVILERETISEGKFTVLGFGDTDKGSPLELSDELQEVEMEYVDNAACDKGHGYTGEVTEDMMCVGGNDKDSCIGDSGGPLIKTGDRYQEDRLVGVVSWGRGCAEEGVPGVYARISYFYDWILETVCENFPDEAPLYMQCQSESSDSDPWDIIRDRPTSNPTKTPTDVPTESPSIEPTESQVPTIAPSISFSTTTTEAPANATFSPTTLEEALFVTWDGSQLKECQGDCDNDDECEGDLICFKRNRETVSIHGCSGYDLIGQNVDVCINPKFLPKVLP